MTCQRLPLAVVWRRERHGNHLGTAQADGGWAGVVCQRLRELERQDGAAGREDLLGEPPARVIFREHQLYVLGVSALGRDAGC